MENFYILITDCKKKIRFHGKKKNGKRDNSNTVLTQSVLLTEKFIKYLLNRVERG